MLHRQWISKPSYEVLDEQNYAGIKIRCSGSLMNFDNDTRDYEETIEVIEDVEDINFEKLHGLVIKAFEKWVNKVEGSID